MLWLEKHCLECQQKDGSIRKGPANEQVGHSAKNPPFLDKAGCIECAVDSIGEAATQNADLVIFTETFIPGYLSWIWRLR